MQVTTFTFFCLVMPLMTSFAEEVSWFHEPDAPGPSIHLKSSDRKAVETYKPDQPIIGTYLFYWYDSYSKAHVTYGDGGDACTDHPPTWKDYSFRSSRWWQQQMRDIAAAGIDFAAPVYWGYPNDYEAWSFAGLPALVRACDAMIKGGEECPKIALFYDTSTLKFNKFKRHIDLGTVEGKAWFYCSVRDFWSFLPPRHWAAIEGRPIVILYSPGFAARQDPDLFPYVRERFRKDFGVSPYIVKQSAWKGEADNTCEWGGALGLKMAGCASVGPGYDHSAVRGRRPLIRDREDGEFYSQNWELFLHFKPVRRPKVAMVETWNEFHEGTDVAHSKEYGRTYIELTRKFADLFHAGEQSDRISGPYSDVSTILGTFGKKRENGGLRVPSSGDGITRLTEIGGRPCVQSAPGKWPAHYVYFDIDQSFAFDLDPMPVTVTVRYYDGGCRGFRFEFDSSDPEGSVHEGAFKFGGEVQIRDSKTWKTAAFEIRDARFANRCNNCDLRLAVLGPGDLSVASLEVFKGK